MKQSKLKTLISLDKLQVEHERILMAIPIAILLIIVALVSVNMTPIPKPLAVVNMWPPHSHEGWPIQKTTSYVYWATVHLQQELNFLDELLPGFNITQLVEDGQFGTNTKNAVMAYQSLRTLTVDGIVGNQTWTYLEYDIFQTHESYEHPISVGFRYPIYSQCRKITNSSGTGLSIFVPIKTQGEWDAFRANIPSGVSDAAGNCDVSGGGGGGGGAEGGGGGGWTESLCARMFSAPECCPAECTNHVPRWYCTGQIC